MKQKIKIYIAGPISKGDYMLNIRRAVEVAHVLREAGFLPYVPHLAAMWHILFPREYEDWMEQDFAWIESCGSLFRVSGESSGADREVEHAQKLGMPVFHSVAAAIAGVFGKEAAS